MKILHTSDWHLGKVVSVRSMIEDQRYFIENIFLPAIDQYSPDVIVLAGDIYDRSIAPVAAIELFESMLYSVAERGIPLIAISGNHDGAERIMPAAKLMRSAGIYLANSINDFFSPIDITAKDGTRARFFTLPYFAPPTAKYITNCNDLKNVNDAYSLLFKMNSDNLATDCPNILVTHCTVTGSITCDSESQISVGGAQQISSDLFSTFDFTCLGHIHSPQNAGKDGFAAYCGSPLRYSFDSNERDKCMLLIDTANQMEATKIPITPLREMRTVEGSFDELLSVEDNCSDDYIFARVTDDRLIYEPMSRLREKYPNILGISQAYLNRAFVGEDGRNELREKMANHTVTDEEIMTSFFHDMCKIEPTDDDIELFNKINQYVTNSMIGGKEN